MTAEGRLGDMVDSIQRLYIIGVNNLAGEIDGWEHGQYLIQQGTPSGD